MLELKEIVKESYLKYFCECYINKVLISLLLKAEERIRDVMKMLV